MEKLLIPAKFVEHYIPKEHLKNNMAVVIGPLGKVRIELEMNQRHMFLAGGWSQFVGFNGITEANTLVLKYDGDMEFRVNVFEPDGFLRLSKYMDFIMEQDMVEVQEASTQNCMCNNVVVSMSDGQKEPKGSRISLKKASLWRSTFYEVGKPSWIIKEINANNLKKELSLAKSFCDAIGLQEPCRIIIKTSTNSTKSWEVRGYPSKKRSSYLLRPGWRRFCWENGLREGDTCTFNVIKQTLWHVDIMRCKECYKTSCTSISKGKSKDDRPSSKGQKRKTGSVSICDYHIGTAPWIQKKINTSKIENRLYLSTSFCKENWTLGTPHDHAQDLNGQHKVLGGACFSAQEELPPCYGFGLEEVLPGE